MPSSILTRAEATHYEETSLHADVMRFLTQLEALKDSRLRISSFGTSPEGRDLPLLCLSTRGIQTPQQARDSGHPIVLVINGIHAGEVEGKEASMMLVRDMLTGPLGDLLERVCLLVVPLFNPDGNDRIDPANRRLDIPKLEGQLGPASGVGTRVNASGINLNRDYMRQDAEEMRLLQRNVCQAWEPHLTVDCHSTNGSVHRFALTYDIPHTVDSGRPEPIAFMREQLLPLVTRRVREAHGLDTFYYGNFVTDEGGTGDGWMTYPHHPRFGSNYRGLTNRLDLLLETYSYLSFEERVRTTYVFLLETLRFVAERPADVVQVVAQSRQPRRQVAVRYKLEAFEGTAEILTREPRTLEGAPLSKHIPHLGRFVGTEIVTLPWAYAVPSGVGRRLEQHGLTLIQMEDDGNAALEVATVEAAAAETAARRILEASAEREMHVTYRPLQRRLAAGTVLVPTEQPLAAIAAYLCEARSDDGAVLCGMLEEPAEGAEFPLYRVLEKPSVNLRRYAP